MDNVQVGYAFSGFRNDGRYLVGLVESVRETSKGTLVILHGVESVGSGQTRTVFKSVYLHTVGTYTCKPSDHWPAGMTRADYIASMGG